MPAGPQPVEREQRLHLAREIAARATEVRGEDILAIGLYGSTARGLFLPTKLSRSLSLGNGVSAGTLTPKNAQSGSQPSFTSKTSSFSGGTCCLTSSICR